SSDVAIAPGRLVTDSESNLFFIDRGRIRKIDQAGLVTTLAGGVSSPGNQSPIDINTSDLTLGPDGGVAPMLDKSSRI
ncbi:MAG: hypothetical protein ACRENN_11015, partial [Candidatus Eiseniibacteriota bacterium]